MHVSFFIMTLITLSTILSPATAVTFSSKAPNVLRSAWFTSYHDDSSAGYSFNVDQINWSKYTHMNYAFVIPTSNPSALTASPQDVHILPQLVNAAHANNVTVSVSLGGWGGSQHFSTIVSSPESRSKFVSALATFTQAWKLDGIDFDWEYPGKQGIGSNAVSPQDSDNFLSLLELLRSTPSTQELIISAAVSLKPFISSTGAPMTNVSQFADVLDYIEIMNYDVWGSWSSAVGPNAPLDDSCAPVADQQGSATSAVNAWVAAGMPAHKIALGVAAYGHSFSVSPHKAFKNGALTSFPPFDKNNQPAGDSWGGSSGDYDFWGLIAADFLESTGQPNKGIHYRFDSCSQTAYVYNFKPQIMVSFDDAKAFSAKGQFIKSHGLRGFAMWEAGSDYHDILLDAVMSGMSDA